MWQTGAGNVGEVAQDVSAEYVERYAGARGRTRGKYESVDERQEDG